MIPEQFKIRLADQKNVDAESLLKALDEPSPVSIRMNSAKWNTSPINSNPVPWCEHGFYLESRPSYTLDPLFHAGCYYPQEASSMFLEQALNQSSGKLNNIRILDLCGAPGGKSTHLSSLIGPESILISNEVIRSRAVVLSETITKWGLGNTIVTQNDPADFGRMPGYFDVVLVDAPCSGEGMFRSNVAREEWSVENTSHCAERQKRILMDVWPALKENGILIYSTCTFNPGENEENIRWLLSRHEAECVRLEVTDFAGIAEIDYYGIYGYGFYPDKIMGEGFFISAIRKTAKQPAVQIRSQKKPELKPGKSDFGISDKWTDFQREKLLKWGDELSAVPCNLDEYIGLFQNLKIVKAGTKIFNVKNSDYLPSSELALSIRIKAEAFPREELSLARATGYLRRDNITIPDSPKGWNIVVYNGVNLGFVKNMGSRLNNYLPVEWRIRMNMTEPGNENIIKWKKKNEIH
jgi:16S rRNA C967 or C1407 C5-methylase (RsmB/RsmF family)/NOL1/NOP2/fmu family ribosome biogenesis protein